MAKRLIRLFGFPVHDAPGEAEAECALLQRHGIVDAVLSEDVDTIMFGCTKTLRNWSAESKTSKTPTHVSLYDVHDMKLGDLGLDREGMVLVALMSGGDYLPDGIPGCGVRVACEAAKAGFGKSICRLKASNTAGVQKWRDALKHELQTNEQKFFRTRHRFGVPEDFPNLEVLRYYTHPVVSPESSLPDIRQKVDHKSDMQLEALREFTRETFDWDYRIGAIKFVRVLGQALLVQNIAKRTDAITKRTEANVEHIKRIAGRRTHFSTDSTPELRISYIPEEVVPIDMSNEVDEVIQKGRSGLALNSDEELEAPGAVAVDDGPKVFDITKPDLAWVLEGLVKASAPSVYQEWQDRESTKAVLKSPTKKGRVAKSSKGTDMPRGALDRYVKTTKASTSQLFSKMPPEPSPDPLQGSPTRPLARSPSKQPSSPTSKSRVKRSAVQFLDSSPSTPRSSKPQKQPETIYISSSPPTAPIPSPLRPSSNAAPVLSQSDKGSTSLRPAFQKNLCQVLKQSSMEIFVTKSKSCSASSSTRPKQKGLEDEDCDSDLEPLSSLTQPTPSAKKASPERTSQSNKEAGVARSSSPKKKLFRARTSAPGFYEEVYLDEEERDDQLAAAAAAAGSRTSSAVRWSDVSIIDLT